MALETPPKVLFVDLSHQFGGASARVLGLLSAFSAEQAGLAVVQGSPTAEQAQRMGLPVHVVGKGKKDWHIFPNLVRVINQYDYQIVDTQNIQSKVWGWLAALWTGRALISTLNSWYMFEHGGYWKGKLYTGLELLTNFRLGGYIVVSETVRNAVQAACPRAPFVELIYNAIGVNDKQIEGERKQLQDQFGFPDDSMICLAVGRLVWAKGYEDLIVAMREAIKEEPSLRCIIIGDGELRTSLEKAIDENSLRGHIILAGYQARNTVLATLKASDLFVMPSRQEGTPIALLEAAAMGVPILATSCGGIPEVVQDGKEALLVPPGRPDLLGAALLRLVREPALRAALGQNAQEHIRQHFSLEAQMQATLAAYRKALQKDL